MFFHKYGFQNLLDCCYFDILPSNTKALEKNFCFLKNQRNITESRGQYMNSEF
jgi:hypothetical protein